MPITFKTKSQANILMLDRVALKLLEMMDFGVTVPGAISAKDVQAALNNLNAALLQIERLNESDQSLEDEPPKATDESAVSLPVRAAPLLKLLAVAKRDQELIHWE